jgi:hypothetical protein
MIFSRMELPYDTTHRGAVFAHNNEQVLNHKTFAFVLVNDFNMGQSLFSGTHLILTLNNKDASFSQDAISLVRSFVI